MSLPNHITCPTPRFPKNGKGKLEISVNGVDYNGGFDFEFHEPLDVYRITPQSGPRDFNTNVKLIGSGYLETAEVALAKFGNF